MKTISLGFSWLLTIAAHMTNAQAYWVVETNARQKNFTIIRFYNPHHELLFEERQQGVFFDPSKRKHKKRLNEMLSIYLSRNTQYAGRERSRNEQKQRKRDTSLPD